MNPYEATPTAAPIQGYDPDAVQMQNRRIRSVAYNQAMQDRVKAQTGSYGNYTNPESLASSYQAQMGFAPTPARAAAVRDPFDTTVVPQQSPVQQPAFYAQRQNAPTSPLYDRVTAPLSETIPPSGTRPYTLTNIVERRNRASQPPPAAAPQPVDDRVERNAAIAGNLARNSFGQRQATAPAPAPKPTAAPNPSRNQEIAGNLARNQYGQRL